MNTTVHAKSHTSGNTTQGHGPNMENLPKFHAVKSDLLKQIANNTLLSGLRAFKRETDFHPEKREKLEVTFFFCKLYQSTICGLCDGIYFCIVQKCRSSTPEKKILSHFFETLLYAKVHHKDHPTLLSG